MTIKIPKNIIDKIFAQAEAESPIEACGYLAGEGDKIVQIFPMTNIDKSPEHFSFDPSEQFKAVKEARERSLRLIAIYHSHPKTPARMSEEDKDLAVDPNMIYVIASLEGLELKAFHLKEDAFYEIPIKSI